MSTPSISIPISCASGSYLRWIAKSRRPVIREPDSGWVLWLVSTPALPFFRYCCSSASIVVGRPSTTIVPRTGRPSAPMGRITRCLNAGSRYRSNRSGGSMMCMSQSTNRSPSFMASSSASRSVLRSRLRSALVRRIHALEPAQQPWPHARALALARDRLLEDVLGHRDQLAARLRAHLDRARRLEVVHGHPRVGHRLADRQQPVVPQDERGLVALEVDLHQAGGRDLVEEDAVRVDQELVLGVGHAQRDVREDEVLPLVERDEAVGGGEVDAGGPLVGGDLALQRWDLQRGRGHDCLPVAVETVAGTITIVAKAWLAISDWEPAQAELYPSIVELRSAKIPPFGAPAKAA